LEAGRYYGMRRSQFLKVIFFLFLPRILEKHQTNSGKILWDEKHKVTI
jgi:hypothetical protein